jgi:hypothetical protein
MAATKKRKQKHPTLPFDPKVYDHLAALPHQTPLGTLVLHGPRMISTFWEIDVNLNNGPDRRDVVDLVIRPRAGSGFDQHSDIPNGVTFDCHVSAIVDLGRCLQDAAHVVGRLGGPVADAPTAHTTTAKEG